MKALKIMGTVIVVLLAVILVIGLVAPKDFNVNRSTVIHAPEAVVWKGISTFEAFNQWNPWSRKDPNMQQKLEGIDGTVGATHWWKGNEKVGEGSMTMTKLDPNKSVEYDLTFIDGTREMHNIGYMTMEAVQEGYQVTWGFKGKTPFPFNALMLFMNMDKMVGKDFEDGLASLKQLCESGQSQVENP